MPSTLGACDLCQSVFVIQASSFTRHFGFVIGHSVFRSRCRKTVAFPSNLTSKGTVSPMLSGISMTCFAASYAVALALESTRLFLRVRIRTAAAIVMAAAGLIAHTLYLYVHVERGVATGQPFASWYHWCLLAAWLLAATYLGLALAHPKAALGLFMLPMVLLLVAVAYPFRNVPPFPSSERYWGAAHGMLFLAGAVVVTLGFVSGLMYLVQSYRLKHKLPPRQGLRLPSLEWLQRINSRSMIVSTSLLGAGLLSGVLLNVSRGLVPWTDPVICISGLLLIWLVIAAVVEIFYKSARRGTKVACLTVASFVFLAVVLAVVLFGPTQHAGAVGLRRPAAGDTKSDIRISPSAPSGGLALVGGLGGGS
jgi:ABC-type uncharacterized transport system permease subunit